DIGVRRRGRRTQQRATSIAEISGEQQAQPPAHLREFKQDARRAENMSSVDESGADALRQVDRLAIDRASAERIEAVERVEHRVKRRVRLVVRFLPSSLAQIRSRLFLLQVRGIKHDKPGEL